MAISLMFGGMVSTLLTLIVIPLGCVSFKRALVDGDDGGNDPEPETDLKNGQLKSRTDTKSSGVLSGIADVVVMTGEVAVFLVVGTVTGIFRWIGRLFKRSAVEESAAPTPPAAPKVEIAVAAPTPAPKPAAKRKKKTAPKSTVKTAAKPVRKPAAKAVTKPAVKRAATRTSTTKKPRRGIRLNTSISDPQK